MQENEPRIVLAIVVGVAVGVVAGLVAGVLGYQGWVIGTIVAIAGTILLQIIPRNRSTH